MAEIMIILKNSFLKLISIFSLAIIAACSSISTTSTAIPSVTPSVVPPAAIKPVDKERTLTVEGLERTYFLHVPSGLNDQQSVPLVFVFHGLQESSTYARIYSGLDNIANWNGFVVVYPDGSGDRSDKSWNAVGCCGYAKQNNVDDPAFVRAIITEVNTVVRVDMKRVYAAGFSNGALLSYRLACEMSDTFAAIAPVAGVLVTDPCQPQRPVSLIHVHGMADADVPFDGGGINPSSGQPFPPVGQSIAAWVKLDGCTGAEKVEHNGIVTRTAYEQCATGVAVELYTISGIGHTWPSQYAVPISQIIWDFFAKHPKP